MAFEFQWAVGKEHFVCEALRYAAQVCPGQIILIAREEIEILCPFVDHPSFSELSIWVVLTWKACQHNSMWVWGNERCWGSLLNYERSICLPGREISLASEALRQMAQLRERNTIPPPSFMEASGALWLTGPEAQAWQSSLRLGCVCVEMVFADPSRSGEQVSCVCPTQSQGWRDPNVLPRVSACPPCVEGEGRPGTGTQHRLS